MTLCHAEQVEELEERIRTLEMENDLLAERADDISLLGLMAEQTEAMRDPVELLTSVLERVCLLRGLAYGACLKASGPELVPLAFFYVRPPKDFAHPNPFRLRSPRKWPPRRSQAVAGESLDKVFQDLPEHGPGFAPSAMLLIPLQCSAAPDGCLLFFADGQTPAELAPLMPLLERVAEFTQARIDNISLIQMLSRLNLNLDQKVAERTMELKRSEERYRTLFDHVPDGVLLVKAGPAGILGRIEDANEAAAAMHGYTLEELKGLNLEELSAQEQGGRPDTFGARVWRMGPGGTLQEELTHKRKDGSTFPVEAIGTMVDLRGRQFLLGFARDITERKQAEQALLVTQRTESIGVLAGGIAHDFNNLLTAIMGQTSMALDLLDPTASSREHLEKALKASEKAAILTKQMLAYSGRGQFTIQPVPINGVIQENLKFLDSVIPKQIKVTLDLEEALPNVTADPGQLQQVVMNLVINGAEAIGDRPGSITIRTRAMRLDPVDGSRWPLCGTELEPGGYVEIEVADTGCGMSRDVLGRVFDPFYTTKPKGHGLGLSAVEGIIRGHRGGLGVDSLPGSGTTFRILLPVHEGEPAPAAPVLPRPSPSAGRVVLVIDDEDYLLEVVADTLALQGHTCHLARSGEEGLVQHGLHRASLDLVLLDLSMPGLGGVETFKRLRAVDPGLPIILSSGYAKEEAMGQLGNLMPDGFLQKPYVAQDLARVVQAIPVERL